MEYKISVSHLKNPVRISMNEIHAETPTGKPVVFLRHLQNWSVNLRIMVAGKCVHDSDATEIEKNAWQNLSDMAEISQTCKENELRQTIKPDLDELFSRLN